MSQSTLVNDPDWWRGAVIYQIYPRSYQDSNGDGIGDLKGVISRLDYIASLGVSAIWLSPFFTSPMDDFGYDVSDYCDVDPMFGTLADFDRLVAEANQRGVRILIDLVLSHTSDRHPWFKESRASRSNPRSDWYVWADPKPDGTPPTNWLSIFGGSSWEWDTRREQYYLHNFLTTQPDLNFHNPDVQNALLDVARFWLERGVSGFRLDTVNFYFHDQALRDNPALPPGMTVTTAPRTNPYSYQWHLYDKNRPENLAFLERLRAVMDSFPNITSVGELGTDHDVYEMTAAYTERDKRLHMTYSFDLLSTTFSAAFIKKTITDMEAGIGDGWNGWALSNHDVTRVMTRWAKNKDRDALAPLLVALVTSLRGTSYLYQGEELGLTEADVPFELLQDPYGKRFWPEFKGRDGCRTPIPWDSAARHGGFTEGAPWLPLPADHVAEAVATQSADPSSILRRVQTFIQWRKDIPALVKGSINVLDTPEPTLVFTRQHGEQKVLCAFNLGSEAVTMDVASGTPLTGHGFSGSATGNTITLPPFSAYFGTLQPS